MKQLKEVQINDTVDENFILQECKNLLKEAKVIGAPIDPKILASFRGLSIIEKEIDEAGILYPLKEGGARICLRKFDSSKRKRFTCCHEIAHTFFPDWQLKPQKRVDKETGAYKKSNQLEYLCDFGASELLMPSFLFFPKLSELNFSIEDMEQLSNEFETSLEATAIKMVKQNPQERAMIIWEEKHKSSEFLQVYYTTLPGFEDCKPKKKLRVKFGYGFESIGHIPSQKSLEETNNIIQFAFLSGRKQKGEGEINFGNFKINCLIEAMPLSYRDKVRILCLLHKRSS